MIDLEHGELAMVREILERHLAGHEVWAYGSRVHGRRKPSSDLDLAVAGEVPLALGLVASLELDFEESDLPFKVDIVDLASVSASFRERICARHEVLLSADQNSAPAPRH